MLALPCRTLTLYHALACYSTFWTIQKFAGKRKALSIGIVLKRSNNIITNKIKLLKFITYCSLFFLLNE